MVEAAQEEMPDFLAELPRLGTEISITGKWIPSKPGGRFRKTEESREMLAEWEEIHANARAHPGVLATEVNHAVGEDAILVHHVFADAEALVDYFSTTATEHMAALGAVAKPELHVVRGMDIPASVTEAITAKGVPVSFGTWAYGYVKNDYRQPDPSSAIQVTAKWVSSGGKGDLDELTSSWQRVGAEAYSLEEGLLRFEVYDVDGEDALIIHETFRNTSDLKFHLTKGTAAMFKSEIDNVAAPANYYFRGPVSWSIRTYSKFMHLPATYSSRGSHHQVSGGSMSDGNI